VTGPSRRPVPSSAAASGSDTRPRRGPAQGGPSPAPRAP
jgi:hypothetical protein